VTRRRGQGLRGPRAEATLRLLEGAREQIEAARRNGVTVDEATGFVVLHLPDVVREPTPPGAPVLLHARRGVRPPWL
jgi:hypothetical protein